MYVRSCELSKQCRLRARCGAPRSDILHAAHTSALRLQAQFMKAFGITAADKADFPFLANKQLWRHDKDQTTNGDDWFGEAVIHPDVVLKDMRYVVAPQDPLVADYTTIFFRNIADGEMQTMATAAKCTDLTCMSFMNQEALPIAELVNSAGPNQVGAAAGGTPAMAEAGAAAAATVGAVASAVAAFALAVAL